MPPRSRSHYLGSQLKQIDDGELIIYPKEMTIIWGKDPRYWRMTQGGEQDPAELIQVCWLEVKGAVTVKTSGKYKISFSVSLREDSFGWNSCKPFIMAKVGKSAYQYKEVNLATIPQSGRSRKFSIPSDETEGLVLDAKEGDRLDFGLYEVWSGKWKGGLVIHHASIQRLQDRDPSASTSSPPPHVDSGIK